MTKISYQRWTPPCGCSFEQEVEYDDEGKAVRIELLFGHGVCGGHEHIAKKSLTKRAFVANLDEQRKEQIIRKKKTAWENNLKKNVEEFENHESTIRIKSRMAKGGKDGALLQDHYNTIKGRIITDINKFTEDKHIELLIGLECPYSLDAQEVYDYIVTHPEEQQIPDEA